MLLQGDGAEAEAVPPGAATAFRDLASAWSLERPTPTMPIPAADAGMAHAVRLDRYYTLRLPPGRDPRRLAREVMEACGGVVESAEVDPVGRVLDLPNDPMLGEQYALHNIGQVVEGEPGTPGADISCFAAWTRSTGLAEVTIAVLDTGVSQSHPDLQQKLLPGINFLSDPPSMETDDSFFISHGTAVAGLAAAETNNGIGIAGVSWRSKVLPVKVANAYGFTWTSQVGNGLIWAADSGAAVASVSLGFAEGSSFLADAVRYARGRNMVICASAGNSPGQPIAFPARYAGVIAIGASNNRDELATFTSTGPEMFLCAPGVDVLTTWDTGTAPDTYLTQTGTSMSCPVVAGVVALVRSANLSLSSEQVIFILQLTADDLGEVGRDEQFGWGRVNAARALAVASNDRSVCGADWNLDGILNSQDLFDFLAMYLSGRADFNGDRMTTSEDLFSFLTAYFSGC